MSQKNSVSSVKSISSAKVTELETKLRLMEIELRRSEEQRAVLQDAYTNVLETQSVAHSEGDIYNLELPSDPCENTQGVDKHSSVQEYIDSLTTPSRYRDPITIRMNPVRVQTEQTNNGYSSSSRIDPTDTARLFNACLSLPARRMVKFNGDHKKYYFFIRNFESTVARYTDDPATLLSYLIEYCEGEPRAAIEGCVILEPSTGYMQARDILQRRYGEPHVIARMFIGELTNGPLLKSEDHQGFVQLADAMKICSATLRQLHYESDLNACSTISAIVQRLPKNTQQKWHEVAFSKLKHGNEPTFDDLSKFVSDRGDVLTTARIYGTPNPQGMTTTPSVNRCPNVNKASWKGSVHTTQTSPTSRGIITCHRCKGNHYTDLCPVYLDSTPEERFQFVKEHQLCLLCLKPHHWVNNCHSRRSCGREGCKGKHHPTLHRPTTMNDVRESSSEAGVNHVNNIRSVSVSLGVIPVEVIGQEGVVKTWALLDQGSDTTLIKHSLVAKLNLQPSPAPLSISTLTGKTNVQSGVVRFDLKGLGQDEMVEIKRAWAVRNLPVLKQARLSPDDLIRWPHLKGIQMYEKDEVDIELLIGSDIPKAHWVKDQRFGDANDPFAIKGPLGWILLGPLNSYSSNVEGTFNYLKNDNSTRSSDTIEECFERLYNREFDDTSEFRQEPSVEDRQALELMKSSITMVDGHLQIALPWKEGFPNLPDNRHMAYQRLCCLKQRFLKDPETKKLYSEKIAEYLQKGHAEKVPEEFQHVSGPRIWYLPHHGVFKSKTEGKIRVVLDCAARARGTSLNLQLRTGPDLTNNLCGVLIRFRRFQYALVADIEAMFHQVLVPPADRDALRFLWWPEGNLNTSPVAYRMRVHPFGATSSPSCASLALKHTIENSLELSQRSEREILADSFYVDDFLLSCTSTNDLSQHVSRLCAALSSSGFRLTKFFSNNTEALRDVPVSEIRREVFTFESQIKMTQRTLGILWDVQNDNLTFEVGPWTKQPTRRSILSHISSLFDPLGLIAPLILPAKHLMQDLCRRKADWDEVLLTDEINRWEDWLASMRLLKDLRIPRWYGCTADQHTTWEVHGFSDASEVGYGASVYLVVIENGVRSSSSLVVGKSRVTPMKPITIPRLELTAAVLVAKMVSFVRQELRKTELDTYLWTDSTAVLKMIRNTSTRYETFVSNRLSTIRSLTRPQDWRHVPGRMNPADSASRVLKFDQYRLSLWLQGPGFLRQTECEWPHQLINELPDQPIESGEVTTVTSTNVVSTAEVPESIISRFANVHTWAQLTRRVGWLLRFAAWVSSSFRKAVNASSNIKHQLDASELRVAESWIFRATQARCFPAEIENLKRQPARQVPGRLAKLRPFVEANLLRVGGRLHWAPLPFETKHPIILSDDHFVTHLLITHVHERNGHAGVLHVLNILRERFWILRGQATVKRVLRKCFHCRRWQARREQQVMAPLPEDRLRVEPPFNTVGVDYFGPLLVKRGRGTEKRYGCVFTCLSMRAIHLEVGHSLETDSFLCALSRFIARRGCPARVYSDNGTNFRGADAVMRRCLKTWDQNKIQSMLASKGCEWHFNPPRASHRGGVWERLIRSIRRIMRSLLGDQLVTDEVLQTTLIEIEGILNNRPLTKLSDDPEDASALTPNHLLLLRSQCVIPDASTVPFSLTRRWRQAQGLADAFWSRWLKEYLPTLQLRERWLGERRNLRVGDLVLVANISMPRGIWPKGIVEEAIVSTDGRVREALVRTSMGILRRDVRSLCILEFAEDFYSTQHDISNPVGV